MIIRDSTGTSENEQMTVSDGFVLCDSYSDISFEDSPFKGRLSIPLFYVFKVNEGHPLVIYNNGSDVQVYPKKDFDAVNSEIRWPAERYKDRIAHDLATFALLPYNVDERNIGAWRKIDYLNGEGTSFGGSLLYAEHGMSVGHENQRAAHVMPSIVLDYFYNWMVRPHRIKSYDKDNSQWNNEGIISLPVTPVREVTMRISTLLEDRFKTKLLLKKP